MLLVKSGDQPVWIVAGLPRLRRTSLGRLRKACACPASDEKAMLGFVGRKSFIESVVGSFDSVRVLVSVSCLVPDFAVYPIFQEQCPKPGRRGVNLF